MAFKSGGLFLLRCGSLWMEVGTPNKSSLLDSNQLIAFWLLRCTLDYCSCSGLI